MTSIDFVNDVLERIKQTYPNASKKDLAAIEKGIRRDWGGDRPYIAQAGESARAALSARNQAIAAQYQRGERVQFLAERWGLSERRVRQIIDATKRHAENDG